MTKEQIIEILRTHIHKDGDIYVIWDENDIYAIADEILALDQKEKEWENMTPIERMKAKGLIDMSYKPYEPPDEVDDTLLGLDGEETWLP